MFYFINFILLEINRKKCMNFIDELFYSFMIKVLVNLVVVD